MDKQKVFKKIENKIIEKLEYGEIPFRKPFSVDASPINAKTGKRYSGVNAFLLNMCYGGDPYFMGFKQAQALGGNVKKGESGFPIMFPIVKYFDNDSDQRIKESQAKNLPAEQVSKSVYYSYGHVWHISQCEGIDREQLPSLSKNGEIDFNPIEKAETLLNNWHNSPPVNHKGDRAFYHRQTDSITIPEKKYFSNKQEVYSTLFHEAIHATGAPKRLDRTKGKQKGDKNYCFEELVAEFGSAFLCGQVGIEKPVLKNQSAYIENWLHALKNKSDGGWIVKACSKAREAAEYIISGGQTIKKAS